jgi:hypothetical protein
MIQIIYSVRGEIEKRDMPFYKRYEHAEKTSLFPQSPENKIV